MLAKQRSSVQLLYVHESIVNICVYRSGSLLRPSSDPAEGHVNVSVHCIANIVFKKRERESLIVFLFVCSS